jgi:cell division protein FtsB
MLSKKAPVVILFLALTLCLLAFLGDESFTKLQSLRKDLQGESVDNQKMQGYVEKLKREVWSLKKDDRLIEKSARENLGMARPDEKIFLFKESK